MTAKTETNKNKRTEIKKSKMPSRRRNNRRRKQDRDAAELPMPPARPGVLDAPEARVTIASNLPDAGSPIATKPSLDELRVRLRNKRNLRQRSHEQQKRVSQFRKTEGINRSMSADSVAAKLTSKLQTNPDILTDLLNG
jgi:hypothetical protein